MKYCSKCGHEVESKIVEDDHRPRFVCPSCNTIHYQNPNVVVGSIPMWQGKILMARRSIEPRIGTWNLPAGFLENGETVEEGAARELYEETKAKIENLRLFSVYSVARINQIHIYYIADLISDYYEITPESSEIQLMEISEIPWDEISFPSTMFNLKKYVADVEQGSFGVHQGWFDLEEWKRRED